MMYNYIPIFSTMEISDTLGYWDMDSKRTTLFLKSFTRTFRKKPIELLCDAIQYVINHETIHGVIQHQFEKDKWSGEYNDEYPVRHLLEDDYVRVCKKLAM